MQNTRSHSAFPDWPGFQLTAGPTAICRCPHKRTVICVQPLTTSNNLFLMSLRKPTNRFPSTCLFSGAPVWPFVVSWPLPLLFTCCFNYVSSDVSASELPVLGNFFSRELLEKIFLLLSQLRGLNLFQPTEHLDSSICSLLTGRMSCILNWSS